MDNGPIPTKKFSSSQVQFRFNAGVTKVRHENTKSYVDDDESTIYDELINSAHLITKEYRYTKTG